MSQLGLLFPIYGKKTCSKPPTSIHIGKHNKGCQFVVHHLDFSLDNDWVIYDGPKEWDMEQLVLYLNWIMDDIWIIYIYG